MALKYNVYIAPSQQGPWTKVNDTPLDDVPAGNSYRIPGLTNGQLYYIMVVAGVMEGSEFREQCSQPITPGPESGKTALNPHIVASKPRSIPFTATSQMYFQATINGSTTVEDGLGFEGIFNAA